MHANKYKASLSRGGGNQGGGSCQRPELARIYFASRARQDAGRGAAAHRGRSVRPGIRGRPKLWGRRGIIGGYWGGYNSLSSSPTPRALPGKVENLTPPANGKMPPPWPCRISSRPAPTTQAQSDTRTTCAAALGFFFSPCFHACPACRISTPARAGCCWQPPRGKAGKYPGSAGHSTRILRPPPAPGKISTASAAPDDHASSRPHHLRPICPAAYSSRPRRLLPAPCTACAAPMMTTTASRSAPPRSCNGPPPEGSDSQPNGI